MGTHPDLNALNANSSLTHHIDFRQIYATVMQEWLCIDPTTVNQALLGETFDLVDLGFSCSSLGIDNPSPIAIFSHTPLYDNDQVSIRITSVNTQHTVVKLFNILGQEIATLKNEILFAEVHTINVKNTANTRLYQGQYIYRISAGGSHYSRSIIVR